MDKPWYLQNPDRSPRRKGFFLARRELTAIAVGLALLGALLFAAGLLLGVYAVGPVTSGPPAAVQVATQTFEPPARPEPEPTPPPRRASETPLAMDELVIEPLQVDAPPPVEPEPVPEPEPPPETRPTPEPPPARPPEPAADQEPLIYEVQLGLFKVRRNAQKLLVQVEERGYAPYIVEGATRAGAPLFSVRLGPYASRSEAEEASRRFEIEEQMDTLLRYRPAPSIDPSQAGAPVARQATSTAETGDSDGSG